MGTVEPVNIDQAITIIGQRIDPDHYGLYAIFKLGAGRDKHEMVLLTQMTHNKELHGNNEQEWVQSTIKEILEAIESGRKVFRFPEQTGVSRHS